MDTIITINRYDTYLKIAGKKQPYKTIISNLAKLSNITKTFSYIFVKVNDDNTITFKFYKNKIDGVMANKVSERLIFTIYNNQLKIYNKQLVEQLLPLCGTCTVKTVSENVNEVVCKVICKVIPIATSAEKECEACKINIDVPENKEDTEVKVNIESEKSEIEKLREENRIIKIALRNLIKRANATDRNINAQNSTICAQLLRIQRLEYKMNKIIKYLKIAAENDASLSKTVDMLVDNIKEDDTPKKKNNDIGFSTFLEWFLGI